MCPLVNRNSAFALLNESNEEPAKVCPGGIFSTRRSRLAITRLRQNKVGPRKSSALPLCTSNLRGRSFEYVVVVGAILKERVTVGGDVFTADGGGGVDVG